MRVIVDTVRAFTSRAAARLRGEEGFTMLVVLGALLIGTSFTLVAIAAADGDIQPARDDQDSKAAYAAAEAGVAYYRYQLEKDPDFYRQCTNGSTGPVVQRWSGSGTDTRDGKWRALPSSSAQYAIELLAAPGYESVGCQTGVGASMVDYRTGSFSIRSTGRSRGKSRSIVVTFRRKGFSDYVYFTDYETVDPQILPYETNRAPSAYDPLCARYAYGSNARPIDPTNTYCSDIPFIGGDAVNGPLHTNDRLWFYNCTSASPSWMVMGRSALDRMESSAPASLNSGCNPTYPGGGGLKTSQPILGMPPSLSSTELASTVLPEHAYVGATKIVMGTSTYTVTNATATGGLPVSKPLPDNQLIYVSNGTGCTDTYNPGNPYGTAQAACADVKVEGTYQQSLTIASQKDIIITNNLERNAGAPGVMGLIAEQYVRIYHPLVGGAVCPSAEGQPAVANAADTPYNIRVDAALLALQHSFTVDNHNCGASLGTMYVTGAIAQKFRGYVYSRVGNNAGYIKEYNYDERMKTTGPPSFVQPTGASWGLLRYNEQIPAR